MTIGTVKFFNPERGCGFITKDDGGEIFVHISTVMEGVEPQPDQRV